jgi:predicted kinase
MTSGRASGADPSLVVVCGLPGVGKTTVAERVAERIDGRLLRTDVVRKQRHDEPTYSAAETRDVYRAVLEQARETIQNGRTAVLDATFRTSDLRERAKALADYLAVEFELLHVACDESVVEERIAGRESDASDADFAVHLQLRDEFEPVDLDHEVIDNSDGLDRTRRQVDRLFGGPRQRDLTDL